ncbi:hypothetical protein RSOLAG22IIIB_08872 [Rhizoctonia solani]|uniref:F-box domain-containing protein n=1 Tax=Rhizoctonia solani TaxID=456999 RepID=A0A0K6FUR9_9AGAM|nr:hypothetical protein RSOLAG22IIIB_08872 [Rhizoctonia solani]
MSPTIASAITKGKRSRVVSEEIPDILESNINSVHDKPAKEEQPPDPKRQRTTLQLAKRSTRAEQGKYKYKKVRGFMDLPIDIFLAINPYLSPSDIISLARTNKSLRRLIMNQSSTSIWLQSMKNVQGIPPCPAEVSVPYYMAFLFMNECSLCRSNAVVVIDPSSVVRLCHPCNNAITVPHFQLNYLASLIYNHEGSGFGLQLLQVKYALRRNFQSILAQYLDLVKSNDNASLEAWVQSKKSAAVKLHKQAPIIREFLFQSGYQVFKEREFEISHRLAHTHWARMVLNFYDPEFRWKWFTRLQRPVPETDEEWTEFLKEVIRFLEADGTTSYCFEIIEVDRACALTMMVILSNVKHCLCTF